MDESTRIVWICQWYPHDGNPYMGDFIQRHAQAVARFIPITTFACFEHASKKGMFTNKNGNLTEIITYYKPIKTGINKLDKALRWWRWFSILQKKLLAYEKKSGAPQLLHVHILLNTGWLGLWAKKKWGTPFLATEHWSGFMPNAVNGYDKYNSWSKKKIKKIISEAEIVTGVSDALIEQLKLLQPNGKFVRVANVVNEEIFNYLPAKKKSKDPVFIHISTGSAQKNIPAMLAGFGLFCKQHPTAQLIMVCPRNDTAYPVPEDIKTHLIWKDDMPQVELAQLMRKADACILYSNYETFGCIIIEANALGIPVVVSDIPVLRELVTEQENGVLVPPDNPIELQKSLQKIIFYNIDYQSISNNTSSKFSYKKIGQQFIDLYQHILG